MQKKTERVVDGIIFPAGVSDFHAHLWLFRYAPPLEKEPDKCPLPPTPEASQKWNPKSRYTGQARYSHCRYLIEVLMPSFEWHDWSEKQIRTLCENPASAFSGSAGSGKSTSAAAYALIFALSAIYETAVLIASTTIAAALQRIWKNISAFYSEMSVRSGGGLGEMMIVGKPRPEIRAKPQDFAHGLFVIAVSQGDIQKAIDELKGRHPKRLLLIGDETDSISQAIVDVQDNLRVGADEFQTIWLGNLPSMFNPLGKIMEPAVNAPVSEECGIEWTSSTGVKCLRFDGEDSPNIRDHDKWRGIIRQKDVDEILRRNHGIKGRQYWIMVKGLPPPEGVDDTVLSEATLNRLHVREGVTWMRDFITFAALDPGFGGDACTFKVFMRGLDTKGDLRILFGETIAIPVVSGDASDPAEYQIAAKVRELCKARSIPPDEFILDSTAIGRGTAAVLQREWSPLIEVCEFNGATTARPVSGEDTRPSNEVYDRLVTELWFSIREFVCADMIRGMDTQTARELCARKWEYIGTGKGKRISVEKKDKMRLRGLPSPNDGDSFSAAVELLRRKGINAAPQGAAVTMSVEAMEQEAESYQFEETYAEELA